MANVGLENSVAGRFFPRSHKLCSNDLKHTILLLTVLELPETVGSLPRSHKINASYFRDCLQKVTTPRHRNIGRAL